MASLSTATTLPLHFPCRPPTAAAAGATPVICGPRDNRGKLLRGRSLTTEAILAVQALKRAAAAGDDPNVDRILSSDFARLVKSDLLAALRELQRQGQSRLALKAFAAARSEPWYRVDLNLYAEMVSTLSRCGSPHEIDTLVADLMAEEGWLSAETAKGVPRFVRALMAAGRGKVVANVYMEAKRCAFEPDEYLFKFMIRGLKRLGEEAAAAEVERDYQFWLECGCFPAETLPVR